MKRQKITIGILCACLVLLGGVWLWLSGQDEEDGQQAEAEEQVLAELGEVALVEVENAAGGYTVAWNGDEAEVDSLAGLPVQDGLVGQVRACASSLESQKKIENGRERLAGFGLDEPEAKVNITGADGGKAELLVGDEVPDAEAQGRYVEWNGEVYVMSANRVEPFLYGPDAFLSKQITPAYEEMSDGTVVTEVRLEGAARPESLQIEHVDSEELAGYLVNSYRLTSPVDYPADANRVEELIQSFFGIKAEGIRAIHPDAEALRKCGLETPWMQMTIRYDDAEGQKKEQSVAVSAADGDGKVAVRAEGVDVIYECSADSFPWMDASEETLLSREILAPEIQKLQAFTVEDAGGEDYTICLQGMDTESPEATYGDCKLEMENVRNFYYMLISMSADEILMGETLDVQGMEVSARVTFQYADGTEESVTYYKESARGLYANIDGVRGCRLSATQLETVLGNLELLVSGETVKARY